MTPNRSRIDGDPQWYKDAIIYQLHVRAFADANGDGIGDFVGLTGKLDYLQDLGVTAIWLLPFYPSPLRDDGYDIARYCDVHESYGTLRDVEVFLREAHARGLRVITELVINHTSDQHPWFQRARRARRGSKWRDYYVWSDTPQKYADARIIFKDFETSNWTWDPVAGQYYWHRFYGHQPDLNFGNPAVLESVLEVLDFWFDLGVDGLRLDAIPYLFEREGTNCENLPETHAVLKELRRHVDEKHPGRMLLAEANQWPEDAVAYFGDGDECHMSFHFPVMPRLFMAVHMEDRFPLIDILEQTPAIPESAQWAIFLRNHDELTLEMVTDEERDYMYRVYASEPQARINLGIRRRLAPLLGNDRRRIELLNGLLLSLPGTPVMYYGDEIGMGDNIFLGDRNGVRTPMQWNADRNAGFSRANPQRLFLPIVSDGESGPAAVNVETQQGNPHSLLWWMKRLIALRRRYTAFGRGAMEFLHPENRKVLAFLRHHGDERILVVANLSRFVQYVELDLRAFAGRVPVEAFGRNEFPPIGELPYLLTLGPHGFYWFTLEAPRTQEFRMRTARVAAELPRIEVDHRWEEVLSGRARAELEAALPAYLQGCRWFGDKTRTIQKLRIVDSIPFADGSLPVVLLVLRVEFVDGEPRSYLVPLTFSAGAPALQIGQNRAHAVIAAVQLARSGVSGVLHDATWEDEFGVRLLDAISRRRRVRGDEGTVLGESSRALRTVLHTPGVNLSAHALRVEQSNTSIAFGEALILKLLRRVEPGINPDLEIGRFLTEQTEFGHTPRVVGALVYEGEATPPATIGILQEFVANEGDAWGYTLDVLVRFFADALTREDGLAGDPQPAPGLVAAARGEIPAEAHGHIGAYLESARLLGQRTGELHLALASTAEDPAFAPEPFSTLYQRSLYQSCRGQARQGLERLQRLRPQLPADVQARAAVLLGRGDAIDARLRRVLDHKIGGERIRTHGDFHLGQVLFTGRDFRIIDFEGEPARPLSERRLKRPALRDVAGMLRSFHYAAFGRLVESAEDGSLRSADQRQLLPWARYWVCWVSVAFLQGYFAAAGAARFLPTTDADLQVLLDLHLIEKALYEIQYELDHRPDWVVVPLEGMLDLVGEGD
jgi:maltose alpha-D-glucosyltransferase/alpha-amylase